MANEDQPDEGIGDGKSSDGGHPKKLTGEDKFMKSMRAFMDKAPGLVNEQMRKDMERVVRDYDGAPQPGGRNPIYLIHPGEAKVLVAAQQAAAPELAVYPFFIELTKISQAKRSAALQEVIDAHNYRIQQGLGIEPELVPAPEALLVLAEAIKTAPRQAALADTVKPSQARSAPRAEPPGASHLAAFVAAVKRNW